MPNAGGWSVPLTARAASLPPRCRCQSVACSIYLTRAQPAFRVAYGRYTGHECQL
ncbi:hypothetical protein C2E23DRAFT_842838, partial [Lenzites betulinus]